MLKILHSSTICDCLIHFMFLIILLWFVGFFFCCFEEMELYITLCCCWALAVGEGGFVLSRVLHIFGRRG